MKKRVGLIALLLTLAIAVCGFVGCSLFDKADSLRISRYPRTVYQKGEDLTGETFIKVVLTKDGKDIALELKFKDANTLVGEADGKTYTFDVANFDLTTESESARRTAQISYENVYVTFQYEVVGVNTFVIENVTGLNNFRDNVNKGVAEYISPNTVVELRNDITLTGAWVPISNTYRKAENRDAWFKGEFRGNGYTISGLTNEGLEYNGLKNSTGTNTTTVEGTLEINYGLFGCVNGARIHDLNLNVNIVDINAETTTTDGKTIHIVGDSVGAVAGYSWGSSEFKNITVNGSIAGYDNVGGVVGLTRGASSETEKVTFDNCKVNATVAAIRRAAGIVAQTGKGSNVKVEFAACKVEGTITGGQYGNDVYNNALDKPIGVTSGYYITAGLATMNSSNAEPNNIPIISNNCVITATINGYRNDQYTLYYEYVIVGGNGTVKYNANGLVK